MDVADRHYYQAWLKALKGYKPDQLWRAFAAQKDLPPLDFSNTVSAVYSSNIEGNSLDLNSYLRSKLRDHETRFKAKEREEIDALIEAYNFAQSHALNEKNVLIAHGILAETLLPKASRGEYRDQAIGVYSRHGLEYVAVEPEQLAEEMAEFFAGIREVRQSAPSVAEAFYHAALSHLVFVHLHPFMDGNGRAARLLEKWLLASLLGREAWHVQSEVYYKAHLASYYKNIKIGLNYYTLNYDRCVPFLTMLVKSLTVA